MRAMFGGNMVSGAGYTSEGPGPPAMVAPANQPSAPFGTMPRNTTWSPTGGLTGPLASLGGLGSIIGPASSIGGIDVPPAPPAPPLSQAPPAPARDFGSAPHPASSAAR